jgi:GT2 family glycosyltransferase
MDSMHLDSRLFWARAAPRIVGEMSIAVVVLTHDRLHLLRRCVERVLARTSSATSEIVIWNNASTDDTRSYLDSLSDPRIRVVHHPRNIGQNAYADAFAGTSAPYLIELDDDVVDAPVHWDKLLLDAFVKLPDAGFLAADLLDDEHDQAAHVRYRVRPHLYTPLELNDVKLLDGPTGGGCAMTSREVYERAGGFRQRKGEIFFLEDEAYIRQIEALGYRAAVLAELKVHHAGGPYYSKPNPHREAYWARQAALDARKRRIKSVLLRLPFVGRLNERFGWFAAPA